MMTMKVASLVVAMTLALASGAPAPAPAQPHALTGAAGAAVVAAPSATVAVVDTSSIRRNTVADTAFTAPGASTYALLALGLFGMGLVSRRRRAD
jgi:hypothetical protein